MVKVKVYSTAAEVNDRLRPFIFKNYDIVSSMVTELVARSMIYRSSAEFGRLHPLDPGAAFTKQEMELLCKGLKQKEKAHSFVRLYNIMNTNCYGFTYASVNPDEYDTFMRYDSIITLAKKVHEVASTSDQKIFSLKTVPVLYTVVEASPFPEEKAKQVRGSPEYQALTLEQKIICDQELDHYREKGLTAAEIRAFIGEYVKFCN